MNNRIALFIIFCLIQLFLSRIALAKGHGHDHDGHEHHDRCDHEKEESASERNLHADDKKEPTRRSPHNHAAGVRFQLAAEVHLAAQQPENAQEPALEEADFDIHLGVNYAGPWYEVTAFVGLGRSLLSPLSNLYGWSMVFGGEFSAVVLDPLHISTKIECESGLYRRRIATEKGTLDFPPVFGCGIMIGPEIELTRWGAGQRGEWSIEALFGLGGEYERQKWGPAQFRFLLGTHFNF